MYWFSELCEVYFKYTLRIFDFLQTIFNPFSNVGHEIWKIGLQMKQMGHFLAWNIFIQREIGYDNIFDLWNYLFRSMCEACESCEELCE